MNPTAPLVDGDEKQLENASEPVILFVDDEPRSLKCFRKILSQDFEIFTASNAAEAIEILEARGSEIGILVADQRMPKTTGVDLIKIARAQWPHIVPLLATAYIDIDATTEAINEGHIFKYIRKPWDRDQLKAQLKEASKEYARIISNAKLVEANRELKQASEAREEFIRTLS
ncbi:MAG: response regulator, partial [Verrucomicrobiota bacterium]